MKSYKATPYAAAVNMKDIFKGVIILLIVLLSIFSLTGLLTSMKPGSRITSDSINEAASGLNGEVLYKLLALENRSFNSILDGEEGLPNLSSLLFKTATNIRFNDLRSLLGRELPGFSIFDGNILVAGEGTDFTNMPIESVPPEEALDLEKEAELKNMDDIHKDGRDAGTSAVTAEDKKTVLLYFTHTRESYLPYLDGVSDPDSAMHSKINVTKVGEMLKAELEQTGIGTSIDKTDIIQKLNDKDLAYFNAYQESRPLVQTAMAKNENLLYLIDIHRDSQRKKVTTAEIGGKKYAKLAFVVGEEHPNYEQNLKVAKELHELLDSKFKGLSRGVIAKKGSGTNGKFNQDLSGNALLLEFGGVDNTFEELQRTAGAFAEIFSDYYWQAEKVDHHLSPEPVKQ
ncbi:stage II sporulation protein P [[Bacillus] enclensis]|jgi:stage II sporulation protein P|uniref:Stage II sporulation protein P n=1 Tax=[Bacillus] enclensis TaxID=1402860 RepID=A0A0V8HNS0_9BACI|nr:stage II sporulation protein P [[Bacillus] enclensis]OAT84296.1 stage II sporulation protein P [Bacillus sp. MKU004]QTC43563.1 stage II sporulation protein P [Bacillus sp. V3]KSU63760.1 stage II sporulation protein P [[Bacillus] enclensis]MBH9967517.1 stage II sporulation protein P [[Bacillus] enclensis]SCB89296.1 stage II sporulation protein P [[Bacillus] enclensis]